jgi:hypothetical protein
MPMLMQKYKVCNSCAHREVGLIQSILGCWCNVCKDGDKWEEDPAFAYVRTHVRGK